MDDTSFERAAAALEQDLAAEAAALSDEFNRLDQGLNKSFAEADQAFSDFTREVSEGTDE